MLASQLLSISLLFRAFPKRFRTLFNVQTIYVHALGLAGLLLQSGASHLCIKV